MAEKSEQRDPVKQESEHIVPEAAEAPAPSTAYPMDEVFRVNHLLQIEDLNWTHQLKQAVSSFRIYFLICCHDHF